MDLVFTVKKSISYTVHEVPFQWEDAEDGEWVDFVRGPSVYTLRPKLHPSYQPIRSVALYWEYLYHGSLTNDKRICSYPHYVSSSQRKYKAAVDSNGALYLLDNVYGLRYRWFIFPENHYYRALDVSDNGEVLIALSTNPADTITKVFLINPAGDIIWTRIFWVYDDEKIFDLRFINTLDKFLIYSNKKLYCFKMLR